jgi:hypothetical protein
MVERTEVTRNQIVNQLMRVGHGKFDIYKDVGLKAVNSEPELFAHLIAWNNKHGQVRDTKVAFPVIALRGEPDAELYENAVAHLCVLDPRNLLRAVEFHKGLKNGAGAGAGRLLKRGVYKYIKAREKDRRWWDKTVIQHRKSMKALYALYHIKPSQRAQSVLFDGKKPKGSVFEALKNLKNMTSEEAAGTILNFNIPFNIAVGAIPGLKNKPEIALALIERMSGNELVTNTEMLKRLGVFTDPALKSAYDSAIVRMQKDKKTSTLKATRAKEFVTDEKAKAKLKSIEEQELQKLGGIDGDWLVLGDKSGSMRQGIELARQVAGLIAQQVTGKVHLVFFHSSPTYFDVSGKDYDAILEITKRQRADGMTSIGVGLDYIMKKGEIVNGIAIATDGGENTHPYFVDAYQKYVEKVGMEPPVYIFKVRGEHNVLKTHCDRFGVMAEVFDMQKDVDFYSLPNVIKTMRTSRYTLVEEIMEVPLMTFADVFERKEVRI